MHVCVCVCFSSLPPFRMVVKGNQKEPAHVESPLPYFETFPLRTKNRGHGRACLELHGCYFLEGVPCLWVLKFTGTPTGFGGPNLKKDTHTHTHELACFNRPRELNRGRE